MMRLTEAIKHLILINILLFVAPKLIQFIDLQSLFALHFPENDAFGLWQYLTHMFMHSQDFLLHIIGNMYALWAFGTPLEQMWGRNKFLFFYLSAGLGAGIIYTLANYIQFNQLYDEFVQVGLSKPEIMEILNSGRSNDMRVVQNISQETFNQFVSLFRTEAVGASGATYGVLVAFGLAFPNAKLSLIFFPVPIAAKYFIPLIVLGDFFFGIFSIPGDQIAHFAHVGGALCGFIIAWYWKQNQFNRWN